MKIRTLVAALAMAAALARPLTAQSKLKVEKLADGVWAAQPEKGANVGWFVLGDGVMAIDAGTDLATGADILKAVAETTGGKPVRYLVITHAHGDHTGGARAFTAAGATVICQESIAAQILALVTHASTEASDPMSGKTALRPVVASISERSILVDGLHNVQIYFLGAAHTKGDLVVYLPNDRILFSGDVALNGRMPFLQSPDVDPAGWEKALETLAKVPAQKLVPGHGDLDGKNGVADSLAYLRSVNALAKKFVDSGIRDEMIDAQIRAPENAVANVPVNDEHVANVRSAVKALREKASRKLTPSPTAAPTPAAKK
jgi:cyclase